VNQQGEDRREESRARSRLKTAKRRGHEGDDQEDDHNHGQGSCHVQVADFSMKSRIFSASSSFMAR
jgi:hypothetical protein